MKTFSTVVLAGSVLLLAGGGVVAQVKTIPGESTSVTVTIEAIEQSSRTLTVKDDKGFYEMIQAPPRFLMYTGRLLIFSFIPGMFFGFASYFATLFGGFGPVPHNPTPLGRGRADECRRSLLRVAFRQAQRTNKNALMHIARTVITSSRPSWSLIPADRDSQQNLAISRFRLVPLFAAVCGLCCTKGQKGATSWIRICDAEHGA